MDKYAYFLYFPTIHCFYCGKEAVGTIENAPYYWGDKNQPLCTQCGDNVVTSMRKEQEQMHRIFAPLFRE